MLKKIILICLMFVLTISKVVLADSSLSDGYFEISNPQNGNTAIVSRDGKKLLGGVTNQSIVYLVRDLFTDKPTYMYKKYTGERIINKHEEIGDNTWDYKDTSARTLFYDLDGKFLFETEDFNSLNSIGDKIVYSFSNNCYVYDINDKKLQKMNFDTYSLFSDDKVVFYNYRYSDKTPYIEVYDKDMKLLKSIDGYGIDYTKEYDGATYLLLSKKMTDDKDLYNYLDTDCNLLFPNDVENKAPFDKKSPEQIYIYDNKVFTYDMVKKEYISTVSEISNNEKAKLEIELDSYYNADNRETDPNIEMFEKTIKSDYVNAQAYEYNGKKIYVVEIVRDFIPDDDTVDNEYEQTGVYVSYSNIYDSDTNLIKERLKNVDIEPLEYGYIVSEDKVYDFDMKLIRELPTASNLERIQIDDNIYLFDRVDERYEAKNSQNLYDINFNTVFEDCENIVISYDKNWIFVTDHDSTKMYDKKLKVIKDLKKKIKAINWQYNDDYMVFSNMDSDRYGLIDREGNIIIDKLKKIERLCSDYIVYMNGFRYGIMDYDKNVIVSVSIFDDIKDDSRYDGVADDYFIRNVE